MRKISLVSLFLLFLSSWVHAFAAPVDTLTKNRAREYGRQALAYGNSPRALAYLAQLHGLRDEVDDLNILAHTYASLTFRQRTHPLVRTTARQLYADIERARGHLTKAQSLLEPLGFVQSFYVLGGFDNEGKSGCETDHVPLTLKGFDDFFSGKNGDITWQKLPVESMNGYVDLSSAIRPSKEVVAYALTFLEASAETRVLLSAGVSGAFTLSLNGQKVMQDTRYKQPRVDQHLTEVTLRKGLNPLLLKVCQESGPLGFFLRRQSLGGRKVRVVLPEKWPRIPKGAPVKPKPQPSASDMMAQESARAPNDAQLLSDEALVLWYTQAFEPREKVASLRALKAAQMAENDASLWLRAAFLQNEDSNERLKSLEKARRFAPESAVATVAWAQLQMQHNHPERSLEALEKLLAQHPHHAPARLAYTRALEMLGDSARAGAMVEGFSSAHEYNPVWVREAAQWARRHGRIDEAILKSRLALGLRYDDLPSRRFLIALLSEKGDRDECIVQILQLLKQDPFDNDIRLRLAELYAAMGQIPEAQATFAMARALAVYDADIVEREGRTWLGKGEKQKALQLFERALHLRPQNPALRELTRELKNESAFVGSAHVLKVFEMEKEADTLFSKEDAAYLVDSAYIHVQPSGQSSRFRQLGIKVYSQRGVEAFRRIPITYSPSRQDIRVLKARVKKQNGQVVVGYSESENNVNEPWTGMYYDMRSRVLSFPALQKGDVLELQYRLDDTAADNLLSDYFGDIEPLQGSYPKFRFQYFVDMPPQRPLYWNTGRLGASVSTSKEALADGRTLYRFAAQKVPKLIPEPGMPGWAEVATTLHVSTYQTWEEVGRYYWGLVKEQIEPNDDIKAQVGRVLAKIDKKDELAVIRAIYQFVVSQTRYVALEFGIHGYKPYRVDRVLSRRFGDCKDKASLIHAMLKVAGIDSKLVLLRMRNLGAIGSEPASLSAFNHAIAYVPKYQLYLDGTAEFHASTELPSADQQAHVLLVEPNGKSTFTTTPSSTAEDNTSQMTLQVHLAADGSAQVKGQSVVKGQNAPGIRRAYESLASRRQIFEQSWGHIFPGLLVKDLSFSNLSQLEMPVVTEFSLDVPRLSEAQASTLRFYPFAGRRTFTESYASLPTRQFDLIVSYPWSNTVSAEYTLPEGFAFVGLPKPVSESSSFGALSMTYELRDGVLLAKATLQLKASRVSASDYPAFRAWLMRVDAAFNQRLVAVGNAVTSPSL